MYVIVVIHIQVHTVKILGIQIHALQVLAKMAAYAQQYHQLNILVRVNKIILAQVAAIHITAVQDFLVKMAAIVQVKANLIINNLKYCYFNRIQNKVLNNNPCCICPNGYSGPNCQTITTPSPVPITTQPPLNPCSSSPCKNGGTCYPISSTNYACSCGLSYFGSNCQSYNPCSTMTCYNNGYCTISSSGAAMCVCLTGFTGNNCQNVVTASSTTSTAAPANPCASNPCKNGGSCYISSSTSYVCYCSTNYYGSDCSSFNGCAGLTCLNGGYCSLGLSGMGTCTCINGFSGSNCQVSPFVPTVAPTTTIILPTNPCTPNPCLNGGICNILSNTQYACTCVNNFYGSNCQSNNPCSSITCQNNGYCTVTANGSPYCVCTSGFSGVFCQINSGAVISPCASSPCLNGGISIKFLIS